MMTEQTVTPEVAQNRKADHDIDPLFLNRWSPRAFQQKEVPNDVLLRVFEAARWAPSGGNLQPWRYIIARTAEDRQKFLSFINPGNVEWCHKAPVLAVLISHKYTAGGNFNRSNGFDAGTSWGYLALEAARQGLITHAMGGFDPDKAREVLGVPEEYELYAVIAIGYRGEKSELPEKFREREVPSVRRPLRESLFEGAFNKSLS
jgi:nitroreductase